MTCPVPEGETALPPGTVGYDVIGSGDSAAQFGLSPLPSVDLFLFDWGEGVGGASHARRPCPGMPLAILSRWEKVKDARIDLHLEGLRLIDYQLNDTPRGGFGVAIPR